MKKFFKITTYFLVGVIIVPLIVLGILYLNTDMQMPKLQLNAQDFSSVQKEDTLFCKDSYLVQDGSQLWELYIKGSGQERGAKQGVLTTELMRYQEDVFINQIREIIPSDNYLSFLRFFITIFNRNLGDHIPVEYRNEIAMMAEFCTQEYNAIGTTYERQLNYHGAHDIGHTMQQYMLVACSSFGAWGEQTSDGNLLIGRNFDFYVGDDFAKNKMLTFASPEKGYRYVSIGWAGMVGVLSGMNEKGLTVSINAGKGAIPTSAAMPISILTREILQYASNIEEAYKIAQKHKTFVSESILIGSATDSKAAIIEKTPSKMALFEVTEEAHKIVSTNHFQSEDFAHDAYNLENIEMSDSKSRFDRMNALLEENRGMNYTDAATILRDRHGKNGQDIGIGNEMTLNQSIAHHAVIFQPKNKRMWVSTSPWQSGKMIAYDLTNFFEKGSYPQKNHSNDIAADSVFLLNDYPKLLAYRAGLKVIKKAMKEEKMLLTEQQISDFLEHNPNHYYSYRILADYYSEKKDAVQAIAFYEKALEKEIPYKSERQEIEEILNDLKGNNHE